MGYITLTELGRLLDLPPDQIKCSHDQGFLPEPPKVSGRRGYDLKEIIKVAEYFGAKVPTPGVHP